MALGRAAGTEARELAGRPPLALVLAGDDVSDEAVSEAGAAPPLLLELAACSAAEGQLDAGRAILDGLGLEQMALCRPLLTDSPAWVVRTVELLLPGDGQ